ncbi:MAG: cysteine desulfurase [Planctomycetota bacterium]|nr:MAG: cysteine desulfurase [Planctomycetota bacterium]
MIYLDWNATAPPHGQALQAWQRIQEQSWGNPSSIHAAGQAARHYWDDARARIARAMGAKPSQLVITGSGSEASNLAIHASLQQQAPGLLVASHIDHSSILRPLAAQGAHRLHLLSVDQEGRIDADALRQVCNSDTRLVCLQWANNELGTLQDVPHLSAIVRECAPQAVILCDACQGAGKMEIQCAAIDVDFIAISGHKFGAPKGVGALLCRRPGPLAPLIHGGQQQQDRRSGTEDVAAAMAMAVALEHNLAQHLSEAPRQAKLLSDAFAAIHRELPQARWLGRQAPRLNNTMNLACPGIEADALMMRLDLEDIAVSRGSACMASRREPSHVIRSLGLDPAIASAAIRISIGHSTTAQEMEIFASTYVRIVRDMLGE